MHSYIVEHSPGVVFARFNEPRLDDRYRMVTPEGDELPQHDGEFVVKPLGYGAFGRVVRVQDNIGLNRAVKLIDPLQLISGLPKLDDRSTQYWAPHHSPNRADAEAIKQRFQDEIKHTNARPYRHILPIVDYGEVEDIEGRKLAYYVSPFLEGYTLDTFLNIRLLEVITDSKIDRARRSALHDLVLEIIDDVLGALQELDEAGVVHMDVKPSNLMVMPGAVGAERRFAGCDRTFLIDLGAARSTKPLDRDAQVPLVCSPYFFPRQLHSELGYSGGYVRAAALSEYGSIIDLYATGRTLELLLLDRIRRNSPGIHPDSGLEASELEKERVWSRILEDDFDVIEGQIDRLMMTDGLRFRSPAEARLVFQTVGKRGSRSVFASRALMDQSKGLRIRLAKNLIRVAPPFDRIVNHPTFQRLKKLHQLTLLYEIFPEATHSRFSHVLNTFQLSKQFLLGLARDTKFRLTYSQTDVDQVLAAALLHDIGQYPFSHTIEDLRKLGDLCGIKYLSEIRHDQELAASYIRHNDGRHESIHDILEEAGFDVEDILYMFQKTPKNPDRMAANIGRDLISGTIDVDRVTYLLHDSYRAGVPYGRAVDLELLVEALCIKGDAQENRAIAIDEVGLSAVEAILTSVYWMYRNVYWRHTNRGFMASVKHVMLRLMQAGILTFERYQQEVYGKSDWDALVYLAQLYDTFLQGSTIEAYNPLADLIVGRRFGYRRVFSVGHDSAHSGLYELLIRKASPKLMEEATRLIAESLPVVAKAKDGDILLDIPLKKRLIIHSRGMGAGNEPTTAESGIPSTIWIRRRDHIRGREWWQALEECSPLAGLLTNIEDHSGRKIRVFFSRDLLGRIPLRSLDSLGDGIKSALKDVSTANFG